MLSRNVLTRNAFTLFKGIPPHVDTHSAFEDGIASVSLGSQVIMYFVMVEALVMDTLVRGQLY